MKNKVVVGLLLVLICGAVSLVSCSPASSNTNTVTLKGSGS